MPIVNLEKERKIVEQGRAQNKSDEFIKAAVLRFRELEQQKTQQPTQPQVAQPQVSQPQVQQPTQQPQLQTTPQTQPSAPAPRELDQFGLPKSTISTAPEREPEKIGFLGKAVRAVLPKGAEEYFGLREKELDAGERVQKAEDAKQAYFRQRRKEENIAEVTTPTEEYVPPTDLAGKFGEVFENKGYLGNVWTGWIKPTVGTVAEQVGLKTDSPQLREWGESFADRMYEEESRRASAQSMADVPAFTKGGFKDPRAYAKTVSNVAGFITSVFGTSVAVTAATGNPAAGLLAGYGVGFTLESSSAYQSMIDAGVSPDNAAPASHIYGVISTAIENRLGIKPAGGLDQLAKDFSVKAAADGGVKKFFKTWAEEGILEEGSQQFMENMIAKFVEENRGAFDNVVESMVAGMVGSFPLVGGGAVISNVKERAAKQQEESDQLNVVDDTLPPPPPDDTTPPPPPDDTLPPDDKTPTSKGNPIFNAVVDTQVVSPLDDVLINTARGELKGRELDPIIAEIKETSDKLNPDRKEKTDVELAEESEAKLRFHLEKSETAARYADASTPMEHAGGKAGDAVKVVGKMRQEVGKARSDVLEPNKGMIMEFIGESKENFEDFINELGLGIDEEGKSFELEGRMGRVEGSDTKLIEKIYSKLVSLSENPTAQRTEDFVSVLRNLTAKTKLGEQTVPMASQLESAFDRTRREIRDKMGNAIGGDYLKLNRQYAKMSQLIETMNKRLGKHGDRGGSLMKSMFSPADRGTKRMFSEIQALTGINLFEEAVYAKFAMETSGDTRQISILDKLGLLTGSATTYTAKKLLEGIRDPAGRAKRIAAEATAKARLKAAEEKVKANKEATALGKSPKKDTKDKPKKKTSLGVSPKKSNLKTPDTKVTAPKGVKKTKSIIRIEKEIAENVEQQKAAIKAGDFKLVAKLKEVYKKLVQKLKDFVNLAKNNNSGFIDLGAEIGGSKAKPKTTGLGVSKTDSLAEEAKKFKTANRFIDAKFNEWLNDKGRELNKELESQGKDTFQFGSSAFMNKDSNRKIASEKFESLKKELTPIWNESAKKDVSKVDKVSRDITKEENKSLINLGEIIIGEKGGVKKGNTIWVGDSGRKIDSILSKAKEEIDFANKFPERANPAINDILNNYNSIIDAGGKYKNWSKQTLKAKPKTTGLGKTKEKPKIDFEKAQEFNTAEEFIKSKGETVYHGSPKEFENFSYDFIGESGTNEGFGFYFTNKKNIAEGYSKGGALKEVLLDIKKPLDFNKSKITKSEFGKFLRKLDPDGQGYLSNWGDVSFDGYEKVLKDAIEGEMSGSTNDVDLISGVIQAAGRNAEKINNILKETLGYDGIIVKNPSWGKGQTVYVVFDNSQIKTKQQLTELFNRANRAKLFTAADKAMKAGDSLKEFMDANLETSNKAELTEIYNSVKNRPKKLADIDKKTLDKITKDGKATILDPDAFKKYYEDFETTNHHIYSGIAKEAYAKALKENTNPDVYFTAGVSGSAKSELLVKGIVESEFDGIIMDGTFGNTESAVKKINQAKAAGKRPIIYASISDIIKSWSFVQRRYEKTGRPVPEGEFARIAVGYIETLKYIVENKIADVAVKDIRKVTHIDEFIDVEFINSSKSILDILDSIDYNTKEGVLKRIKEV